NMPDMSGPDVIKLFRASSAGAERLPIVVLSADATPAAKQESLDAGANDFLTKPVTSRTLLSALQRAIPSEASRRLETNGAHHRGNRRINWRDRARSQLQIDAYLHYSTWGS